VSYELNIQSGKDNDIRRKIRRGGTAERACTGIANREIVRRGTRVQHSLYVEKEKRRVHIALLAKNHMEVGGKKIARRGKVWEV